MGCNEDFTFDGGVHPLPATSSAANKVAIVDENAAPELDGDVAEREDGREEQVSVHLLAEKLLVEVVLLILPVLMAELAIINRSSLFLVVVVHRLLFFNNTALIKEIILLAAHNHMENEVNDEEHGCPVEARWVNLGCCASRAEARDKSQAERE